MAKVSLATIKNWFKTGLKPTQVQFWDTWDSFRHKDDQVPAAEVAGLDGLLAGKAETTHLADPNAHNALFEANGLQMIELDWSAENPMDSAGETPIDFLNNLSVPLVLSKRSLVKIKYRFTAPSDGDVAVTRQWVLLLLEAGSYGSGFPAVVPTVVNDASISELQLSSRNLLLSSSNAFAAITQDEWNVSVEAKMAVGIEVQDSLGNTLGNLVDSLKIVGLTWDDVTKTLTSVGGNTNTNAIGVIDGTNRIFTAPSAFQTSKSEVFLNGLRQRFGAGFDYVELDNRTIQFEVAPAANADAWVLIK